MSTHAPDAPSASSREFAFVCACLARHDAHAVPMPQLDDERVAAIARRHQVMPLVVAGYRRTGTVVPPALAKRHDPVAPFRLAREAIRLRALLEAEGIEPLFLKGSALAMLAYGSLDARQFGDIDLLVRPSEAAHAATLLGAAGYRLSESPVGDLEAEDLAARDLGARIARLLPLAKDIALTHRDTRHVVELHWRMTDNPHERPPRDHGGVQMVEITPGTALPTLEGEALFAYLCAHGAAHLWARLRWLGDVAALLANADDGGERLWIAAVARGQERAAASAILLAHRFLDTPLPPGFAPRRSLRLRLLVAAAAHVVTAGGGTTDLAHTRWRGWAEMGAKLLLASDLGDLRGWSTRLLFSVPAGEHVGPSRLWYVTHPLQRIPKLLKRRRLRRDRRVR
ncbi:nucleotidyltransferase family protein [Sphingomonas faeni]